MWCLDCAGHVLKDGAPWDRTWFAQHNGEDCPFEEKPDPAPRLEVRS